MVESAPVPGMAAIDVCLAVKEVEVEEVVDDVSETTIHPPVHQQRAQKHCNTVCGGEL